MKLPSIRKKPKPQGSTWKLSLFKPFKANSLITKPKSSKNSGFVLSDTTASRFRFISALDSSWSKSRQYCCYTVPKDSQEVLLEMASKALRSNRLFFEQGANTNSILEEARFPFKDCVAFALEKTGDPYMDYRISMEEIVEACELKDQEHLEELLAWYLKMNRKNNHGFIVGAFIDMFATVN